MGMVDGGLYVKGYKRCVRCGKYYKTSKRYCPEHGTRMREKPAKMSWKVFCQLRKEYQESLEKNAVKDVEII
jgi:uncharacterized OB-fold protein